MGSRNMKLLPIGLSLATTAYGVRFTPSHCYDSFGVDYETEASIAEHCAANPGLGEYCKTLNPSIDPCIPKEKEGEDDEDTNFSDNSLGYVSDDGSDHYDSDSMIEGRMGGTQSGAVGLWIQDVFQYCRETGNCDKKWEVRALPKIEKFQRAFDATFKQNEPERYSEYMAVLNKNCYVVAEQCARSITTFTDITVPTYDNNYDTSCIRCVIVTMRRHWNVNHVDATNSGLDESTCMGPFCKALKQMKERLHTKIQNQGGIGAFNNALSADFGDFHTWRHKKNRGGKK